MFSLSVVICDWLEDGTGREAQALFSLSWPSWNSKGFTVHSPLWSHWSMRPWRWTDGDPLPSLPNSSLSPLILSHLFPPCVSFLWLVSVSLCGGKTQEPQLWSDWTFADFGNDFVLFCSGFDPLEVIGKGIGFTVEWPLQQHVCICVLVFWGNRYRFASPWRMMWPHDVLVFR